MARVLIATPEPIGRRLAGPAIRAAHMARVVGASHEVDLVSLAGASVSPVDGRPVHGPEHLDGLERSIDAAVVQGRVLVEHPALHESSVPLAIDWFDPFHTEALHRGGADRIRRRDLVDGAHRTLLAQAERGDFFVASNDAQRLHWLGWLAAAGRCGPTMHDEDPTMRTLIDVAPFGTAEAARGGSTPIRDTFSAIGSFDPVIVWAGGLHDWLDPMVVIDAMPAVLDAVADARLVFLAGPHPNTSIETMGVRGQAINRARERRLFGTHVLFVTEWIDYGERLEWLADATVGVVADTGHLESMVSHRTRLLDHAAAGLPTVGTDRDPLTRAWVAAGAGLAVPPSDPRAFADAIAALCNDPERRSGASAAARSLAESHRWEQTLDPLCRWLANPRPASDRGRGSSVSRGSTVPTGLRRAAGRVRIHLDEGGPTQVAKRTIGAARRRLGR